MFQETISIHLEVYLGAVLTFATISAPIWWDARKQRKAEHVESGRRHDEAMKKLDELIAKESFLPSHYHIETEGQLHAEGIIRKQHGGC